MSRYPRRRDADPVHPIEWAMLNDEPLPDDHSRADVFTFSDDAMRFLAGLQTIAELWAEHRDRVLAEWIRAQPGTRPSMWWRFDAPMWPMDEIPMRWRGAYFAARLRAPRRRLAGTGTAKHDVLAYVPEFAKGVPVLWLDQETVDRYNGRGITEPSPWTRDFVEGAFPYDAVDPDDPPIYEAEATYLKRHGLLTSEERGDGRTSYTPCIIDPLEGIGPAHKRGA